MKEPATSTLWKCSLDVDDDRKAGDDRDVRTVPQSLPPTGSNWRVVSTCSFDPRFFFHLFLYLSKHSGKSTVVNSQPPYWRQERAPSNRVGRLSTHTGVLRGVSILPRRGPPGQGFQQSAGPA